MTAPAAKTAAATGAASTAGTAAAGARSVQLTIRAALLRDVTRLWPALDPARLDKTFPGWLRAMITLTRGYHSQSAQAAALYYRHARTDAIQSPTPRSIIRLAAPPSDEWMGRAFGFAGPGMLTRDTVRPNTALTTTLGTAARVALDGGRTTVLNTVHADPVAVGWYRVTDGAPCAFCALLAARGIAYKTQKTAGFQSHNLCGCNAAPAFSRNQPLPEISRVAAQLYADHAEGTGTGNQLPAFRKAWDAHLAS